VLGFTAAMARRRQFRGVNAQAADLGRRGEVGCLRPCIVLLVLEEVGGRNGTAVSGAAAASRMTRQEQARMS
jgi:hypothetical protein